MTEALARLRDQAERLADVGRAEGIEVDGPLGRWLEGQVQALAGLADVLEGQEQRFDGTLARIEAAAKAEVDKLTAALQGAGQVVRQGEIALRQARQVQLEAVALREEAVDRMIDKTLPMFAERLQKVLAIREHRWNADLRRKRYAVAGAVALGVFLAGYSLAWWQDSEQVVAFGRCLEHPLQAAGHFYCAIDSFVVVPDSAGR